jgi:hypothetical protein
MDHIPPVSYPFTDGRVLAVPLLDHEFGYGDQSRGFAGFQAFGSDRGCCPSPTSVCLVSPDESDERRLSWIACAQSWLYFGLLVETFGKPRIEFDVDDFISTDAITGEKRVTTTELPRYAWYLSGIPWSDKFRMDEMYGGGWMKEAAFEWFEDLDLCLQLTASTVNHFVDYLESPGHGVDDSTSVLAKDVLTSIAILAEYIHGLRNEVFQYKPAGGLTFRRCLMDEHLLRAGWCKGEISNFMLECNLTCRYYLGQIDRHALRKDHSRCDADHGCLAHQISNYGSYRTVHTSRCGKDPQCEQIGPCISEIIGVLRQGAFPTIVLNSESSGDEPAGGCKVYVVPRQEKLPYVAISHVWSDGLGNQIANKLPRCQLQAIQARVNALFPDDFQGSIPFWIDTLCVPLGDVYPDDHGLALDRMAETYRYADKVLVLDSSLTEISPDTSLVEIGMKVRYRPWMGRLWTLFEGRSAHKLFFQLSGKAVADDTLQDVSALTNAIMGADKMLRGSVDKHGIRAVLSNPSSKKLIQALASKHNGSTHDLPWGQVLEGSVERVIAQKWFGVLCDNGPVVPDLSDADEQYFEDLREKVFDPVINHARSATHRTRTTHFHVGSNSSLEADPLMLEDEWCSDMFSDVVRSFRRRTTSRLEDETICLGTLMGIDLQLVRHAKSIDWKLKDVLMELLQKSWTADVLGEAGRTLKDRLQETPALLANLPAGRLKSFVAGLAAGADKSMLMDCSELAEHLSSCHEERMKILLETVGQMQQSVIFWNTPRLRSDGWGWAPFSMLHKNLDFPLIASRLGDIVPGVGIEVRYPGFKLIGNPAASRSPVHESGIPEKSSDHTIHAELCINIRKQDMEKPGDAWVPSWQHVKLCPSAAAMPFRASRTSKEASSDSDWWSKLLSSPTMTEKAVIVQDDQNKTALNSAILVDVYKEEAGFIYARHLAHLERGPGTPPDTGSTSSRNRGTFRIEATVVSRGRWYVG